MEVNGGRGSNAKDVVGQGSVQVNGESSQRVDTPDLCSHCETNECEHGKAAVFQLLHLELIKAAGHEGGEDAAGVADLMRRELVGCEDRILVLRSRVQDIVSTLGLNPVHHEKLESDETSKVEGQVNGGTGGVPENIRVSDLLNEDAGNAKHGPPAKIKEEEVFRFVICILQDRTN